jgi:hypothetical protein
LPLTTSGIISSSVDRRVRAVVLADRRRVDGRDEKRAVEFDRQIRLALAAISDLSYRLWKINDADQNVQLLF